jgi:hypothetical protein
MSAWVMARRCQSKQEGSPTSAGLARGSLFGQRLDQSLWLDRVQKPVELSSRFALRQALEEFLQSRYRSLGRWAYLGQTKRRKDSNVRILVLEQAGQRGDGRFGRWPQHHETVGSLALDFVQ